jgi:hypothetical protein
MRTPVSVRPLLDTERNALTTGLRTPDAFTPRRCQLILASARGECAPQIAVHLGCYDQAVRNAIHAFNWSEVHALTEGSSRPHRTAAAFDAPAAERLRALLHQSPRAFGKPMSVQTLNLAAEICCSEGITAERVTGETVGHEPRSGKYPQNRGRDRLIRLATSHPDWVLGFAGEVWWSRITQPRMASWADKRAPLRLIEQRVARGDPDAAVGCGPCRRLAGVAPLNEVLPSRQVVFQSRKTRSSSSLACGARLSSVSRCSTRIVCRICSR